VIPLLPEAELCFTVKAVGLGSASWLLEHATPEQLIACVDLDGWEGTLPDRRSLDAWIGALVEAGEEPLLRGLQSLDPELLTLFLKSRVEVFLRANDDDWQPPIGADTLDGQFFFRALGEGDDAAPIVALLRTLFENDYWSYFRLLQSVIWELEPETEEWALRWRAGRLEDLGFPPWERGDGHLPLPPARSARRAAAGLAPLAPASRWQLPVAMPRLPANADERAALPHDRRARRRGAPHRVPRADRARQQDRGGRPPAALRLRIDAARDREGRALRERRARIPLGAAWPGSDRDPAPRASRSRVPRRREPRSRRGQAVNLGARSPGVGFRSRDAAPSEPTEWMALSGVRLRPALLPQDGRGLAGAADRTPSPHEPRHAVALLGRLLAESGFAVVLQECRGRHASEGRFAPFLHEAADGGDAIAWVAGQPWCDGRLGLIGWGYSGFAAWAALSRSPRPVGALVAAFAARDPLALLRPGGALALELALRWGVGVGEREPHDPRRLDLGHGFEHRPLREADRVTLRQVDWFREWIEHPVRDAYWEARIPAFPEAPPPALLITGWRHPVLAAQLADFSALREQALRRGAPEPELMIGPWPGGQPPRREARRTHSRAGAESLRAALDFLTRRLRGEPAERAPVRVFVCGASAWREATAWPLPEARAEALHLRGEGRANGRTGDGTLSREAPAGEEPADGYEYDPRDPVIADDPAAECRKCSLTRRRVFRSPGRSAARCGSCSSWSPAPPSPISPRRWSCSRRTERGRRCATACCAAAELPARRAGSSSISGPPARG
jgi:hypothetical protein